MPYQRKDSPYLYVRKKLPGYGDTGPLSTRVKTKKQARDMERLLEDLANWALLDPTWTPLLDAVCRDKSIPLPDLLSAKNRNTLDSLKASLNDPLLSDCIREFREAHSLKKEQRVGLDKLESLAPKGMKLSELTPQMIVRLCRAYEKDVKRNSVRRYLLQSISRLLRFKIGNAERDRIFADVDFPGEDDTREVHLSQEEIAGMLNACLDLGYTDLHIALRFMLLTSADRGVVFAGKRSGGPDAPGLRLRDVEIWRDTETDRLQGKARLNDTKTKSRARTVPISHDLCDAFLVLMEGKRPDDQVFNLSYPQVDIRWQRVRKRAGLEHVHLKDLRSQYAIYGEEAGINLTVLSRGMGHNSEAMTRRYQARRAALSYADLEKIEAGMLRRAS
jgi:integrase